jgi:hypothetical protein
MFSSLVSDLRDLSATESELNPERLQLRANYLIGLLISRTEIKDPKAALTARVSKAPPHRDCVNSVQQITHTEESWRLQSLPSASDGAPPLPRWRC